MYGRVRMVDHGRGSALRQHEHGEPAVTRRHPGRQRASEQIALECAGTGVAKAHADGDGPIAAHGFAGRRHYGVVVPRVAEVCNASRPRRPQVLSDVTEPQPLWSQTSGIMAQRASGSPWPRVLR